MAGAAEIGQAVSAARFYLDWPGAGKIAISEVSNIQSKVVGQEYIYNDASGETRYTKQFGKTEPPTVTIKRALDKTGSTALLKLHALARVKDRKAIGDYVSIVVLDAVRLNDDPAEVYTLEKAWVSEISIQGLKAGDSQVATMDVKIVCESINATVELVGK